jgi:hypothetical protein
MFDDARELLLAATSEAEIQDLARRTAIEHFWSARVTTALDYPACPHEIPTESDDVRVQIVSDVDVLDSAGPRFAALSVAKTRLMAEMLLSTRPSTSDGRDLLEAVEDAAQPWEWDVTIIAHDFSRPRFTHDSVYFPGMVGGQVVVWDYQGARIVCAGRVAETNSPDVIDRGRGAESAAFEADPVAFLEADLMRTTWLGAARDVRQFDSEASSSAPTEAPADGSSTE